MSKQDYITMKGLVKLKKRLDYLNNVERPEVVRQVVKAREMGDLSENAEYHAARERQRHIDKEISHINNRIGKLKVIDPDKLPKDAVRFGAVVEVKQGDTLKKYRVVGIDETTYQDEDDTNPISIASPIGRSLVGAKKGETIRVKVPRGELNLEVVDIK